MTPRPTALRLTPLESRLVPAGQVVAAQVAELPPPKPAETDPTPVWVGTDADGETIYTLTVEPSRKCGCLACLAITSSDAPVPAVPETPPASSPPVQAAPPPASVPPVLVEPVVVTPAAVAPTDPGLALPTPSVPPSAGPSVAFGPSAVTPRVDAPPVQPSVSRFAPRAEPDLTPAAKPDAVVTPAYPPGRVSTLVARDPLALDITA